MYINNYDQAIQYSLHDSWVRIHVHIELKKIILSEFFFQINNYFFSTSTPNLNKLDGNIPEIHFSLLQVPVL